MRPVLVLPVLLVLLLVACAPTHRGLMPGPRGAEMRDLTRLDYAAQVRGGSELRCPIDTVVIVPLGAGGYRIEGCGAFVLLNCIQGVRRESVCAVNERGVLADASWTDQQAAGVLASVEPDLMACIEPGASYDLDVRLQRDGSVTRVGSPWLPAQSATCIDASLGRARLPGSVAADRVLRIQVRRPVGSSAAPAAPSPATAEAAARAAVDGRVPAILACVATEALSMQVSWTSEGRLDALLRGDQQGTPEEACVRAIVQQLSIPAPGMPGTIVHAIQR